MPDVKSRGLGSLLSPTARQPAPASPRDDLRILDVPVTALSPSPRQPRRTFAKQPLQSLADSLRQHGLLQPLVVRPHGEGFQLIAGERRWRAAQLAGIETVRVICKPASDADALGLSLIENLQREDLDPIEEATAYRTLLADRSLTHEQLASYVGKDRATVSNALRLLELPPSIQARLASGSLTAGHARVLLAVTDATRQAALANRAADRGLSVRELERLVYGAPGRSRATPARRARAAHLQDLERRLSEHLGLPVQLVEGRRGGRLVVRFRSNEEFMRLLDALGISPDAP
jgi:ParB family chromosome partitioning protein